MRDNNCRVLASMSFKGGVYYIGDPCDILPDDLYQEFLNDTIHNELNVAGIAADYYLGKFKGYDVLVTKTMKGDGCFTSLNGNSYFVESGLIAIISGEYLASKDLIPDDLEDVSPLDKIFQYDIEEHSEFAAVLYKSFIHLGFDTVYLYED